MTDTEIKILNMIRDSKDPVKAMQIAIETLMDLWRNIAQERR